MNSKKAIKIWTTVLIKECDGKSAAEQKKIILRLKEVLRAKKREYLLKKIVENALNAMKKRARFEITLAHDQSEAVIEKLEDKLGDKFGKDDAADINIDPKIIGGFVAKTDEYLYDASVKGWLEQLKKNYQF